MRALVLTVVLMLAAPSVGCGGDAECSCGGGGAVVDFTVTEGVAAGGTVEVCYRETCRAGEIVPVAPTTEGQPYGGTVRVADLGDWRDDKDRPLTIRVLEPNGEVATETDVLAERHDSCCGLYWTINDDT